MNRRKFGVMAVVCGLVIIAAFDRGVSFGADRVAANRCTPEVTSSSVAYHCWAAYPEAFYAGGYASSQYQINWSLDCGGLTFSGGKPVKGFFKVLVNQFTSPTAYQLMISNDVCKVNVVAVLSAGNGSIKMGLFINRNDPSPAHN